MLREHARLFSIIQFASDLVLTLAAFPLAYLARINLDWLVPSLDRILNPELHPLPKYSFVVGLSIAWWAIGVYLLGLYRLSIRRSNWEKIRIVLEGSIILAMFLGFTSFAFKLDISRPLIGLFVSFQAIFLILARVSVAIHSRHRTLPLRNLRHILIVGTTAKARELGKMISRYSDWGLQISGYLEAADKVPADAGPDVLGAIPDIPQIIENNVIDEIIFVGTNPRDLADFDEVLRLCTEQGVRTRIAADIFPTKVSKVSMEFLESVPLITFSTTPDHALSLFVKRVMDVAISLVLLLALSPFLFIVGLLIWATSGRPIIYRQVRCGLYGRKFVLYKFRSMNVGAEDVLWEIRHLNEMDGPVFKMRNDPRVTTIGRTLRKSSIDELPQLLNVLIGDMSLVGPRAPLPEEVKEYTRWQRRRLSVKPGITCLWQVSGRNEIDFHEWMKLDLHYIDNWSLMLDLKILLRTFPVVLLGKGAR
jgi:exopolysaccharide biosynthesis polyprenyl glycosylphosphotransferase